MKIVPTEKVEILQSTFLPELFTAISRTTHHYLILTNFTEAFPSNYLDMIAKIQSLDKLISFNEARSSGGEELLQSYLSYLSTQLEKMVKRPRVIWVTPALVYVTANVVLHFILHICFPNFHFLLNKVKELNNGAIWHRPLRSGMIPAPRRGSHVTEKETTAQVHEIPMQ